MAEPRPARIAILDSGINTDHPHIQGMGTVEIGHTIGADGIAADLDGGDTLGHGTAVASAILDLAPGSTIYSIRVFLKSLDCPFEHVLVGLEQAIAWGPDLVNLSLGTTLPTFEKRLVELVDAGTRHGARIVAPASMSGLPSYPGSLPNVEAVVEDPNLPRDEPVRRPHGDRHYWFASPYPRDLPGVPRAANLSGISMATANVTGYLARQS